MQKRGLEHLEVVLAFLMFIGFIAFALYFFSPVTNDRITDSILFYARQAITENITTSLDTYSITINEAVTNLIVKIPLNAPLNAKAHVEDADGNTLEAYYDNGFIVVKRPSSNIKFVIVYFNEDYTQEIFDDGGVNPLNIGNYSVSSSDSREVISEKKAIELKAEYNSDYEKVKEDFNIPARADFDFSITFLNADKIAAEKTVPNGLEVFADSKRMEVVRIDGTLGFADLVVRVW